MFPPCPICKERYNRFVRFADAESISGLDIESVCPVGRGLYLHIAGVEAGVRV